MARANCAGVIKAVLEGKACGMRISKESLDEYEKYTGVIDELCDRGCLKDTAFNLVHKTIITGYKIKDGINLFSLKRDSPIRKQIMEYLFNCVISGKRTTREGYIQSAGTRAHWTDIEYEEHYSPRSVTQINNARLAKSRKARILNGDGNDPDSINSLGYNTGIKRKMGFLSCLCTTGQTNILFNMIESGYGNNAYESFCIALKWASERLESEKSAKEKQP
jgi:hypothetical protein